MQPTNENLASELPRALARGEIIPYYQPLIDLHSSRVVGFEVLARWCLCGRDIPPAEFIPVAEACGLIGELTEHLLHQACIDAAKWPAAIRLSINISPKQLGDAAMPKRLDRMAALARFPFDRLTFEVTEGAVIDNFDRARTILGDLKSLGATLAIDDFGTGFSGLRHLQLLPFDSLKLDAAFVRSITNHRESRKIVAAVMGLCQSLGLLAVAEGIESPSQLEILRSLGYSIGQGWLFGYPAPAAQANGMLEQAFAQAHTPSTARIAEQTALRLEALPIQCLWQLRALYEDAPVGLAFVDPHLRYVAVNERLAEMHGVPVAALIGRPVADVIPDFIEQVEPTLRRALAGEAIRDVRTNYAARRGTRSFVLQSSYQPIRDAGGEIVGVSVAVVDVTPRQVNSAGERPQRSRPAV